MFEEIAREFTRIGGEWAAGVPGGGPGLNLLTELERAGVALITTGHESTAALASGACGAITGRPALAFSIKGPGLANLLPGLVSNGYESYPTLSLSESYPKAHRGPRWHKWIDHAAQLSQAACSHVTLAPGVLTLAWRSARSCKPSVAHLELAAGYDRVGEPGGAAARADGGGGKFSAARPIVVAGQGCLEDAVMRAWLGSLRVPVFTTAAAKGLIDETLPFAAGVYTGDGRGIAPETALSACADAVVFAGVGVQELLNPASGNARRFSFPFRGDLPPSGDEWRGQLLARDAFDRIAELEWGAQEIAEALAHMRSALKSAGWSPFAAMEIAAHAHPDARHVLDTGNFTVVGEHALIARQPWDVLGSPCGRYLGVGPGYALGASLADRNRRVVLWIGDGGIRALGTELGLFSELGLPITVMLMCDGGFGSIRGRAGASSLTVLPLRVPDRPWGAWAEAHGLAFADASGSEELASVLSQRQERLLVCCRFDADRYCETADLLR